VWSFDALREANTELFNAPEGLQQIVTISPHCFNTFKNEYPGLKPAVSHYTEFLAGLIDKRRIVPSKSFRKRVTYHDPCFLGKQNNIYDAPRKILSSIHGLKFIEFDRNRENSLCCEGGGGRMWIEVEEARERLANIRVRDAAAMGVDVIAVACPFCMLTLEDALKAMNLDEKIQIMDIGEIVARTLA
jgi:Fe-S oxidoreductase